MNRKFITYILAMLMVVLLSGCDMSIVEEAIKELRREAEKPEISSLTMRLDWQDADGHSIDWPNDVAGVKFQLLQQKNNESLVEYGDKIVFTSESPNRTISNVAIKLPDGKGNTDRYKYTVRKPTSGRYAVSVSDMVKNPSEGYSIEATILKKTDEYQDPHNPQPGEAEVIIIEVDESEPNFQLYNMRATTNVIYQSSTYWEYNLSDAKKLFTDGWQNSETVDSDWALTGIYLYYYENTHGGDNNETTDFGIAQGGVKQRLRAKNTYSRADWLIKQSNRNDRTLWNVIFGTSSSLPSYSFTGPVGNKVTDQNSGGTHSIEYIVDHSSILADNRYASKYDDYITWEQQHYGNTDANWNAIYNTFAWLRAFDATPGRVNDEVYNEYSADQELEFDYNLDIKNTTIENIQPVKITDESLPAVRFMYSAPAWSRSNDNLGTARWLQRGYVSPYNSDYGIESKDHIELTTVTIPAKANISTAEFIPYRKLMKQKGVINYRRVRDISFSVGNFDVTDVKINPELVYNYVKTGSEFFVVLKEDQMPTGGQIGWIIKVTLAAKGKSETKTISLVKE